MLHPLVLLLSATLLLWQNRLPLNQPANRPGAGNRAALFTSGLLFWLAAACNITERLLPAAAHQPDFQQLTALMAQLAMYAALPFMVINGGVQALGYDWDKTIWGRILLAICAVFALTRTTTWLDYWLLLILVCGLLTFVLPLIRQPYLMPGTGLMARLLIAAFWLMLCVSYMGLDVRTSLNPNAHSSHWSWLGLTLLPYLPCWRQYLR